MRVELDCYIVDVLMRGLVGHDRQPSAFILYLFLYRITHGQGRVRVQMALADMAEQTGLSKRSVQDALGKLERRQLLSIERSSVTAIPWYTVLKPWVRRSEK